MTNLKPLVVDLDGSLLRTDSLDESIAASLRSPVVLLRAARALATHGKAGFKRELAPGAIENVSLAPFNAAVVDLIEARARAGGEIALATGADRTVAEAVAARVPHIDRLFASDGEVNLTGERKARALIAAYGEQGFDYVGNSTADIPVWRHAASCYVATRSSSGTPSWASDVAFADVLRDPAPSRLRVWLKAIRPHQSLKNVLLFLPLIAAHQFTDPLQFGRALLGFICFSLMASAVYLLNDTLDISADRKHHRKSSRSIAAGWVSPLSAIVVSAILAVLAVACSVLLGPAFLAVLLSYAALTTSYSLWLKRVALIDVVILALLYMVRIVAGAIATGIVLSFWFTGVTLFLFLSLALVKRYAEAHRVREETQSIPGRGYSGDDVHAILALGSAAGVASVLLGAIYIQSESVRALYGAPAILWLVIPIYFYWIANLWLKSGRGQMHDDPLVFALRDRASVVSAALIVVVFVIAAVLPASWPGLTT